MTGLRIQNLTLSHFRSYEHYKLPEMGNLVVFIGHNGVGKTNILEGIQLLTACESFRHPQIAQLIREGQETAILTMACGDGNRSLETRLVLEPGKKRYTVNGKAKAISDVKGVLPAVSFIPDDLDLAKKSSSVKRRALDELGSQISKNYYVIYRDYEKTLRYKNRLLKDGASRMYVESTNDTLTLCGTQLFCYRTALFNRMLPLIEEYYGKISQSGEVFSATYLPSWERVGQRRGEAVECGTVADWANREKLSISELMRESLDQMLDEELDRKRSLIGPHNDQITFEVDRRDASQFASQGQQRSIVLAWKLAEVEMVRQTLGTTPVLLLDDVMSELDEQRRSMLVGFMTEDIQTFITATDLSSFDKSLLDRATVVEIGQQL